MPKDYAALPYTQIRRDDRAIDDGNWIRDFLHRTAVGSLATVHDGQPFINQNLFFYDEAAHVIYTHTAQVGRTRANVEGDQRVCFMVSEMGRLLPAEEALEFSVEYNGVAIFGTATIVTGDEARHGLQCLLDKYFTHLTPGQDYRPITKDELKRTTVYRIDIEQWSGKRKKVEDDFPGAFMYGQPPQKDV